MVMIPLLALSKYSKKAACEHQLALRITRLQTYQEKAEFFVNRRGQSLFGLAHLAATKAPCSTTVVFCHPISWEKQFSYRALCEFSRYLAAHGYSSFRFDAYGFGDSDGDLNDASVASMIDDTTDAIRQAEALTGCSRVVLMGVRFGATIAALVSDSTSASSDLILVSPIIDGNQYWREILRFSRLSRMSLGQQLRSSKEINAELETSGQTELDGEIISKRFVEEMRQIQLDGDASHSFNGRCLIRELKAAPTNRDGVTRFADLLRERGGSVELSFDEPREFWLMQTRYQGYLPSTLFEKTKNWLDEAAN